MRLFLKINIEIEDTLIGSMGFRERCFSHKEFWNARGWIFHDLTDDLLIESILYRFY